MKYSIIIPLYNKQHTIRRAIYSVLDQENVNSQDVEVLIIDDGSTDQSVECVKAIQQAMPSRMITLHQQTNKGVSSARNQGVTFAAHDLIAFLDADDAYKPAFISTLDKLVNAHPKCGAFATAYEFISSDSGVKKPVKLYGIETQRASQTLKNYFASAAMGDLPFCSSSICVRKNIFKALNGFPEGENMGEDQSLFSQIALRCDIAYSAAACASYYVGVSGSLMQSEPALAEMPFSERLQIRLENNELPNKFKDSVKQYIAGHLIDLIRRNLKAGNIDSAEKLLSDPRSQSQLARWLYWNGHLQLAKLRLSFGSLTK